MSIMEEEMEDITVKFRLTGEEVPSMDVRDDMGIGPPQRNRLNSAGSQSDGENLSEEENSDDSHQDYNKPLMYPRQRAKLTVQNIHKHSRCRRCLWGFVYLFIFSAAILASVFLVIYFVNSYTNKLLLDEFKEQWTEGLTALPCSDLKVEDVWVKGFPKLLTESAFRLLDVNRDGVLDVIMGFATGGDKLRADTVVCDIYFNGSKPCGGGIMALDGRSGVELWRTYSLHEIFSVNCNADLDGDHVPDCIGGGQFIEDMDGDGVKDILNIHGGDPLGEPGSNTRLPGKIMFFSGRSGRVLRWSYVPDMKESYYSPVLYNNSRGLNVLFGTGGETHPGALWSILLKDLWDARIDKARRIYSDQFKGIMTPPSLIDITGDGTEDVIFAAYNSTILAVDGESLLQIWNYSFPMSETYASPAPGFYNNDSIPDFLVRWQYGPGFPIYYHSIMTILDGKTGKPIIQPFPQDSVGAQSSPLTISMERGRRSTQGHDLYLYWIADCMFHDGEGGEFTFKKGTNVHEKSRSDFCKLRFKSDGYSQLLALNQHMDLPGKPVYTSWKREKQEHAAWVNTTEESIEFLRKHPDHMKRFLQLQAMIEAQKSSWQKGDIEKEKRMDEVSAFSRDYGSLDDPRSLGDLDLKPTYSSSLKPELGKFVTNNGRLPDQLSADRLSADRLSADRLSADRLSADRLSADQYRVAPSSLLSDKYEPSRSYVDRNSYRYRGSNSNPYDVYEKPASRHSSYYANYPTRGSSYNPLSKLMTALGNKPRVDGMNPIDSQYLEPRYQDSGYHGYRDLPKVDLGNPHERIQGLSQGRGLDSFADNYNYPRRNTPRGDYRSYGRSPVSYLKDLKDLKERDLDLSGDALVPKAVPQKMQSPRRGKRKGKRGRVKRHLGPHDEGGLQRLISTGTLAPTLLPPGHKDHKHSIEVVFATYWFYPAKTQVFLPEDESCIAAKMDRETQRFDPDSKYYGMDHDGYQHAIQDECLELSGHQMPSDKTYESQSTSTAYNLHMGQMTVYRLRLTCKCGDEKTLLAQRKRCLRILPFDQQQWAGYMGSRGTSQWRSNDNPDRRTGQT